MTTRMLRNVIKAEADEHLRDFRAYFGNQTDIKKGVTYLGRVSLRVVSSAAVSTKWHTHRLLEILVDVTEFHKQLVLHFNYSYLLFRKHMVTSRHDQINHI